MKRLVTYLTIALISSILALSCMHVYLDTKIDRNTARIDAQELETVNIKEGLTQSKAVMIMTVDENFLRELDNLRLDNSYMEDYIREFNKRLEDKYKFNAQQEDYEERVR